MIGEAVYVCVQRVYEKFLYHTPNVVINLKLLQKKTSFF